MAILRQVNLLGQERLDLPSLRAIESGNCADMDLIAGSILAGNQSYVVSGFNISVNPNPIGLSANNLQLIVANGVLMNPLATEAGTIYTVPSSTSPQTLNSVINSNVTGTFQASSTNIVGIDLLRTADISTSAVASFIPANATLTSNNQEIQEVVPTARTLNFNIVISNATFGNSLNLCPIAIVTTDSSNNVVSIEDARPMMFRLATGSDSLQIYNSYSWPATRFEDPITLSTTTGTDPFYGGDKAINSLKAWSNAIMSRLQEIGGGQFWYSPVSNLNLKLVYGAPTSQATNWVVGNPTTTIASGSDGVSIVGATSIHVASTTGFASSGSITVVTTAGAQLVAYTGVSGGNTFTGCTTSGTGTMHTGYAVNAVATSNTLTWSGLIVSYDNNISSFSSNVSSSPITDGSATVSVGQCLYVDVNRSLTSSTALTMNVGTLNTLGMPGAPYTRFVIAWVINVAGAAIAYARDSAYVINAAGNVATASTYGSVKLATITTPQNPVGVTAIVPNSDSSANVVAAGITRGAGSGSPPSLSSGTLNIGTEVQDTTIQVGAFSNANAVNIYALGGLLLNGPGPQEITMSGSSGNIAIGNATASGATISIITDGGTVDIDSSGAGVTSGETVNIGNYGTIGSVNGSAVNVYGNAIEIRGATGSTTGSVTIDAYDGTYTGASSVIVKPTSLTLQGNASGGLVMAATAKGVTIGGTSASTNGTFLVDGNSDNSSTKLVAGTNITIYSSHTTQVSGKFIFDVTTATTYNVTSTLATYTYVTNFPNGSFVIITPYGVGTNWKTVVFTATGSASGFTIGTYSPSGSSTISPGAGAGLQYFVIGY